MKTLPHAQTTNRLVAITALLACPSCGGPLQLISDTSLQCGGCQRRYPVRAGVPILLPESMPEPGVGTVSADDPVSRHPYSPAALEIIAAHHDGWVLDLGAGGKFQRWDNVIQVDIFRYPMTDVVATADRLPFRDNAFKAVISQAVFEHLQYPEWAAAEIRRVLQPGGAAKIDTAFLQPEHGYPHHFYNATETGLRHWFRDFDIQWSGVEAYQHPKWSLTWFLGVYLDRIGEAQAAALRGATLQQLLDALDSSSQGRVESEHVPILAALDSLPAHAERTLAAGVSVHLINPVKGAPESKAHHADTVSMHGVEDVRKLIAAREENALLRRAGPPRVACVDPISCGSTLAGHTAAAGVVQGASHCPADAAWLPGGAPSFRCAACSICLRDTGTVRFARVDQHLFFAGATNVLWLGVAFA